ncbi:MAG TPA: acyl-CoA dehydrogenase family protein, partial [Bacillales bacterium]|nr:acyl-CoA dehydrogenase family protein [Bacillales bacterium]
GEPAKGFKYMAEALNISRICNATASVGIMRRAFAESLHYASGRRAFGKPIAEYAMVKQTVADLLVECEVNTGACFEMVRCFDRVHTTGDATEEERVMARMLIPLMKYRTGEAAKAAAHQAIETHGGNGYIEEYVTPRLLRDAQVLSVWEGPANILALDLIRVMKKDNGHEVFFRVMQREIENLRHPKSEPFKGTLNRTLKEAQEALDHLMKQSEDVMTYHMKSFADCLVDLYELVTILKEAEDQAHMEGNLRKFTVAKLFQRKHFALFTHSGILETELEDLALFKDLVEYKPVY